MFVGMGKFVADSTEREKENGEATAGVRRRHLVCCRPQAQEPSASQVWLQSLHHWWLASDFLDFYFKPLHLQLFNVASVQVVQVAQVVLRCSLQALGEPREVPPGPKPRKALFPVQRSAEPPAKPTFQHQCSSGFSQPPTAHPLASEFSDWHDEHPHLNGPTKLFVTNRHPSRLTGAWVRYLSPIPNFWFAWA